VRSRRTLHIYKYPEEGEPGVELRACYTVAHGANQTPLKQEKVDVRHGETRSVPRRAEEALSVQRRGDDLENGKEVSLER
jgi:hypothetical protein